MALGRPSKLTPETQATIVEALREGLYRETAATLAGIHRDTMYGWLERGRTGEAPYAAFSDAVEKAEAEAEQHVIREVRMGLDGWQSKAWVAERRWPRRWGGRVRATVSDELAAVMARIEAKLDPETFAKVVDATREDAPGASANTQH
jgi:transposase